MVIAPMIIAGAENSRLDADCYRRKILLLPEGRALQQDWMKTETVSEAVWINIAHGLTTFNNLEHDQ